MLLTPPWVLEFKSRPSIVISVLLFFFYNLIFSAKEREKKTVRIINKDRRLPFVKYSPMSDVLSAPINQNNNNDDNNKNNNNNNNNSCLQNSLYAAALYYMSVRHKTGFQTRSFHHDMITLFSMNSNIIAVNQWTIWYTLQSLFTFAIHLSHFPQISFSEAQSRNKQHNKRLMPRSHLHVKPPRNSHVREFSRNGVGRGYLVAVTGST